VNANVTTAPPHQGKILVVDDDRLVLATLAHGLSQAGYEVVDADNGDDAILLAREHRPDLALLDIRMEGKSGFDVAAYLRDVCHMPFMFLSAFTDDDTVRQVKALGAVAYLVKPLDIRQIVPAVEAAFANLRAGRINGNQSAMNPAHAASAAAQSASAEAGEHVLEQIVALAVGVLMHRFSLARGPALDRLKRMASTERTPLAEQAEKLVAAVELLSKSGAD
jgi:two-component system, response regulator PdtaR